MTIRSAILFFALAAAAPAPSARGDDATNQLTIATNSFNLGVAAMHHRNFDTALAEFTLAIELKPDYAAAFNQRGQCRGGLAHGTNDLAALTNALADYNQAIQLDPGYAEAYFNRGIVKQIQEDYDGAFADFSLAITNNPRFAVAYYNRGLMKVTQHDFDGAIDDYDRAILLRADFSMAYASRGLLKEKVNKDLTGAQADFDKSIQLRPDYYLGYQYRANLRHLQGDTNGADADLRKAQELQHR